MSPLNELIEPTNQPITSDYKHLIITKPINCNQSTISDQLQSTTINQTNYL